MKKLVSIFLILTTLSFAGCEAVDSNIPIAETFLTKILTIPDEAIYEIMTEFDWTGENQEEFEMRSIEAMLALCSGSVAPEKMLKNDPLFLDIYFLHVSAATENRGYTVAELQVEQGEDKRYIYTAVLDTGNPNRPATAAGSLTFNRDNKIDSLTIDLYEG